MHWSPLIDSHRRIAAGDNGGRRSGDLDAVMVSGWPPILVLLVVSVLALFAISVFVDPCAELGARFFERRPQPISAMERTHCAQRRYAAR